MPRNKTYSARSVLKDKVLVESEARGHKLVIDEPKTSGGTDLGMTPVEITLSGIGSCLAITARTHSRKFKVDLQEFYVDVEADIDSEGSLGLSDVRPGFLKVRITYHIKTDADQATVKDFLAYVEAHCPISDTVRYAVNFEEAQVVFD